MFALSQVLSLRIAKKQRSHSAEVIGNEHAIFNSTNNLGNLSLSHFLIAFVNLSGIHSILFIKSSSYSSKIGEISTFSLSYSEHKTDGVCIPIRRNIPFRGNSVCIFFISSGRIEIFKLNFAALIQVSTETF